MEQQIVLQARGLIKNWGQHKAVDGIDLELRQGECFALLGPNGAGKTTTCEILEGLVTQDQGSVQICGLEQPQDREKILQKMGVQLQETHLYKKYTVVETVELFASFYKKTIPVETILEQMQLQDKRDSRLETLSGGQKQRVYLGCALVHDPKILFLDEPTTGLDPQSKRMIWELLQNLLNQGRSLFLTTHSMEEAEYLSDRVAIMDHGKIIAQGDAESLIKDYANSEVLKFDVEEDRVAQLKEKVVWLRGVEGSKFVLNVSHANQKLLELVQICHQHQIPLRSIDIKKPTLEDVFLNLTGRSIRDV